MNEVVSLNDRILKIRRTEPELVNRLTLDVLRLPIALRMMLYPINLLAEILCQISGQLAIFPLY